MAHDSLHSSGRQTDRLIFSSPVPRKSLFLVVAVLTLISVALLFAQGIGAQLLRGDSAGDALFVDGGNLPRADVVARACSDTEVELSEHSSSCSGRDLRRTPDITTPPPPTPMAWSASSHAIRGSAKPVTTIGVDLSGMEYSIKATPQPQAPNSNRQDDSPFTSQSEGGSVVLFVDQKFYADLETEIHRLADDIARDLSVSTVLEVVDVDRTTPEDIRAVIQDLYENSGLVGSVLIGDIPTAYWGDYVSGSPFPTDAFYEDLDDTTWVDPDGNGIYNIVVDEDGDGEYDWFQKTWIGEHNREVWCGRLLPPGSVDQADRIELLRDYLNRNHQYRVGGRSYPQGMGTSLYANNNSDTTPPTGRITSPSSGTITNADTITIEAEASDSQSGISWVKFWVYYDGAWHEISTDNEESDGWSATWDASGVSDQPIWFTIWIQDGAGNQVMDPGGYVDVTLDRTEPTGEIVAPGRCQLVNDQNVSIVAQASDNLSGIKAVQFQTFYNSRWHYLVTDEDGSDGWSATWDIRGLDDQTVGVWAFIYDQAGNLGSTVNWEIRLSQSGSSLVDDFSGNHTIDIGEVQHFANMWRVEDGEPEYRCALDLDGDGSVRVPDIMEVAELLGNSYTTLPTDSWIGRYYDNGDLARNPVLIRNDPELDFAWGQDSPDSALPSDNFSAEWARAFDLLAGSYCFDVSADDGVRLRVDDSLIIDEWHEAVASYSECVDLSAGTHVVILEYFERLSGAAVSLSVRPPGGGDHALQDIACHLLFWWRGSFGDSYYIGCADANDYDISIANAEYNGLGQMISFDMTATFDTGDVYIAEVRDIEYDTFGRVTDYEADVSGSYLDDTFHQTLNDYVWNTVGRWTEVTVEKVYGGTESYDIDITACWSEGDLTGYRAAVYGGPYNGDVEIIGECD